MKRQLAMATFGIALAGCAGFCEHATDPFDRMVCGRATPQEQEEFNAALLGAAGAGLGAALAQPTTVRCQTRCNPQFTNCVTVCQ